MRINSLQGELKLMKKQKQQEPESNEPLMVEEIERLLNRYEPSIIKLIAYCNNRTEQHELINLFNNPRPLNTFLQQAAGTACAYAG